MKTLCILVLLILLNTSLLAWIPEREQITSNGITYTAVIPEGCVRFDQTHPDWLTSVRREHLGEIIAAYAPPAEIAEREQGDDYKGRGYMVSTYMIEAPAAPKGDQTPESMQRFATGALQWIENTQIDSETGGKGLWNGLYENFADRLGIAQPMMLYFQSNHLLGNFIFCMLHGNDFHEKKAVVTVPTLNWCSGVLANRRILLLYHARVAQGSTAFDVGAQEINRWTAAMIQANPGG